ncbi:MAG TPA: hypothetical protein VK535_06905 [Gemmatimonadales bacterium]|nr:hypothetical protein [Gemmatimonadales bacterium]
MHNRTLLRGILAGTVVLTGVSACSRSDRAGTGRDTTQSGANAPQPSAGAATQDTTVKSGEAAVSGYRGMEQDSVSTAASDSASPEPAPTGAASPLDSAGVTSDYALTGDTTSADTTSAGYSEMARDTSSAAGRGDTAAVAVADTTTRAESDTASIKVQMDTTQVANADTLQDSSGRIRPPEDSTEIRGNMTDAAGAAPIGGTGTGTGIDAVSLMSRAGVRCVVKDDSSDGYWDLSNSPAALNPCGSGTMTLSLVRTGEK